MCRGHNTFHLAMPITECNNDFTHKAKAAAFKAKATISEANVVILWPQTKLRPNTTATMEDNRNRKSWHQFNANDLADSINTFMVE